MKRNHKIKTSETTATTTEITTTGTVPSVLSPTNLITDVFADQLLQKAKTTTLLEESVRIKTKNESVLPEPALTPPPPPVISQAKQPNEKSDDFDIPTISEIAKNSVNVLNRRRDLNELAELQKKINQAKKQLKALGQEESEDEDFINIKDDFEDMADDDGEGSRKLLADKQSTTPTKSQRVPITFDKNPSSARPRDEGVSTSPSILLPMQQKKRSIMDRLGVRPSRSAANTRRSEKEIYVPVFRRKDDDKKIVSSSEVDHDRTIARTRERDRMHDRDATRSRSDKSSGNRERVRDLRDRVREKSEKAIRSETKELQLKNKVGSRIIVAPPKPEYDEDAIEVPVNSVVKVQPRPVVPNNKQASKNLLLRAVAEAQKSTALCKIQPPEAVDKKEKKSHSRSQKLYSKSYRDSKSKSSKLKDTDNIVIEVSQKTSQNNSTAAVDPIDYSEEMENDEDYEMIEVGSNADEEYVYIPLNISSGHSDEEAIDW